MKEQIKDKSSVGIKSWTLAERFFILGIIAVLLGFGIHGIIIDCPLPFLILGLPITAFLFINYLIIRLAKSRVIIRIGKELVERKLCSNCNQELSESSLICPTCGVIVKRDEMSS